ncbi:hypothetical protein MMC14_001375 [Varicellaria rhodocarpa]|nr:hypothetical protein [Varicellaria rhodocarpa]
MDVLNQHPRSSLSLSAELSSSPRIPFQENKVVQSIEHDLDYEEDREASLSGSARQSSGPDEMVFDDNLDITRQSSPRTSHHSDDDISELPNGWRADFYASEQRQLSPYTPIKTRSPFRNPSSVRAMQLETTPPPHLTSRSSQQRYKLSTPSRNSTPRSVRSHHSTMHSPSKLNPSKKVKREYPLVLLHVTILPIVTQYPQELMEMVLPGYIMENWKLLRERVTDTVLERGILIPHPKEDYDLLEERLLESLELKIPRILKCGHFHLTPDEEKDAMDLEDEDYDSDNDLDICDDCGRRVRDGHHGSGTGLRRWDIKIYAANGLMRAGAWGAAWNEMERVDVEILPFIEDDLRRELELRKEEDEERCRSRPLVQNHSTPSFTGAPTYGDGRSRMDDARMREIYGEDAQAYLDDLTREDEHAQIEPKHDVPPPPHSLHSMEHRRSEFPHPNQIPLWTLLKNYIYLASQDRRNIAILLLGTLVIFLSLSSSSSPHTAPPAFRVQELCSIPTTTTIPSATMPVDPGASISASSSSVESLPPTITASESTKPLDVTSTALPPQPQTESPSILEIATGEMGQEDFL